MDYFTSTFSHPKEPSSLDEAGPGIGSKIKKSRGPTMMKGL